MQLQRSALPLRATSCHLCRNVVQKASLLPVLATASPQRLAASWLAAPSSSKAPLGLHPRPPGLHCRSSMQDKLAYTQPTEEEIKDLVEDAVVWANQHGLAVALAQQGAPDKAVIHAPIAALPVAFPRERFLQAKAAQPLFNQLVDAVAKDEAYLETTLAAAAKQDEFINRLIGLMRSSRPMREASAYTGHPEVALGVHRSDYMLDTPSEGFLQVELNTIASSFGCLSSLVTRLHAYVASRLPASCALDASRLPANPAIDEIPDALAAAVTAQGTPGGVVIMVVQPGERNAYDQQWIQLQLWQRHKLRTLRRTLSQIAAVGHVDTEGTLHVPLYMTDTDSVVPRQDSPSVPVSLVYFRAGYVPTDYPTEAEWVARGIVERSNAAKCPTVAYQLAGAKKVQQDLARPGVLERFTSSPEDAATLRTFFAGLWGLDDLKDPDTAAIVAKAIDNPEAYVLKPQREGGGNNFYGAELASKLKEGLAGPASSLSAYILMQRILPPPQRSFLIRAGAALQGDTLSELGVYGVFVRKGDQVVCNKEAGHLVRTKFSSSNEGGVAAGFAVLDSPYLV